MKRIDPKQQFSKWLARFGAIVWGIYSFVILALVAYRPEAAMSCVWLTLIMTANKVLDTVSYTRNSITEKIILGTLERFNMEVKLKSNGNSDVADDDAEGDDNG